MTQRHVIFVGGPDSGKSNYLFRIWIALERQQSSLQKAELPDDLGYLHENSALLLNGSFAPHTSRDLQHTSNIPVKWRDGRSPGATLVMPDGSGELWLALYEQRAWPQRWDDLITAESGIVLMVRDGSPQHVRPLDWITCERLYAGNKAPAATGTPTQVLLVDWLQILHSIAEVKANRRSRLRLSVVISAWDQLDEERRQTSPMEYLNREFPLLAQFIDSGDHGFDARLFGLSIFGGDPKRDPEFKRRVQIGDPTEFGYAVKYEARKVIEIDVLEPIYWAMGADR